MSSEGMNSTTMRGVWIAPQYWQAPVLCITLTLALVIIGSVSLHLQHIESTSWPTKLKLEGAIAMAATSGVGVLIGVTVLITRCRSSVTTTANHVQIPTPLDEKYNAPSQLGNAQTIGVVQVHQGVTPLQNKRKYTAQLRRELQKVGPLSHIQQLQYDQRLLIKVQNYRFDYSIKNAVSFLKSGWKEFIGEFKDKTLIRRKVKAQNSGKILVKYSYKTQKSKAKKCEFNREKEYRFTVPNSVSLMPKHGKMSLFGNSGSMQTTLLLDLEKCKLKEEHIYKGDGQTGNYGSRSWEHYMHNEEAAQWQMEMNDKYSGDMIELYKMRDSCTLEELRVETAENQTHHYNELLVGAREEAVMGIAAPMFERGDYSQIIHYANKIMGLIQQQQLYEELGIAVPLFLYSLEKGFQHYSEEQIEKDFCILRDNLELRNKVLSVLECQNIESAFEQLEKALDIP